MTDAVLAQMERVLSDDLFVRSPRLSQLFRFTVEMSVKGKAHLLKEYTIAVDVFKRSESFDTRLDSIVRVEAARLRRKLDLFYEGSGFHDRLILTFPPSGYEPVLSFRDERIRACSGIAKVAVVEGRGSKSACWMRTFDNKTVEVVRASREALERRPHVRYDLVLVCIGPGESYSDYGWVTNISSLQADAVLFLSDTDSEAAPLSISRAVNALSRDRYPAISMQPPGWPTHGPLEPMLMDSVA